MLTHPTLDQLHALGLHGMAKAFADIEAGGEAASLGHAEWLALLLEREASLRRDKRLSTRLRYAKLRQQACVEDIDYRTPRGLDRALFPKLVEGHWIDDHANLLICGPVRRRQELARLRARPQGLPRQSLRALSARPAAVQRSRAGARRRPPSAPPARSAASISSSSTTGASSRSMPPPATTSWRSSRTATAAAPPSSPASSRSTQWHALIGDPTYADAVLDRLVHNAHRIDLNGESLRRARGKQAKTA